jgi:hypothetical protein
VDLEFREFCGHEYLRLRQTTPHKGRLDKQLWVMFGRALDAKSLPVTKYVGKKWRDKVPKNVKWEDIMSQPKYRLLRRAFLRRVCDYTQKMGRN